jgi:hypothetical protein
MLHLTLHVYLRLANRPSAVIGASAGAVNLKTHRKWVWAYIEAITKLVDVVVSLLAM